MEPIWRASYPEHMPFEVDVDRYDSLVAMIKESCSKYANHKALTNMGTSLSYADVDRLSTDFAAYLQQACGFQKGDRFAIMMPNVLQYVVVLFGALKAGLVVVNINPLYTRPELIHHLNDSGATGIVVLENFAHTLEKALPSIGSMTIITSSLGDLFPAPKRLIVNVVVRTLKNLVPSYKLPEATTLLSALSNGSKLELKAVPIALDDLAFLQYTGGTTGTPKAAMLTHGNIVANVQQALVWSDGHIKEGVEIAITPLPLYHIFSLTLCCFLMVQTGNEVVLITNPRDLNNLIKTMRKVRWTMMAGINTLYNALLHHPKFAKVDTKSAHLFIAGGAATSMSVAKAWQARTGVPILEGYGLTETSPVVSTNPFSLTEHIGSVGIPVPGTFVDIKDDEGNSVPLGSIGELCVKGPQVMKGYWNASEQTADAIDADGWFHTGDVARMDQRGYLFLVDRKKDMVLVSGFNVYPSEIKQVLMDHEGILEVSVIGVPDEHSGETVKAVIVKKDANLTEQSVRDFCRANLTNYKRPKFIQFVDELPKTPIGKVLRRELREQHIQQMQQNQAIEP